jgi:FkbM family methyltransferase
MNAVPASAAARFPTTGRPARVLRPVVNALLPGAPTTVEVRAGAARGIRLRIDPRREKFYWTGLYETGVQDVFERILAAGDTVWDIGAHVGFFTALAARCVGPTGRVHAFEPQPANRARLEETVALNGLECVAVHALALAGQAGTMMLYGHGSTSMWSLVERPDVDSVPVTCTTLDDLAANGRFGVPRLVKIDAENTEIEILRSGRALAESANVAFVVELGTGPEVEAAGDLLPNHGFRRLSARHWLLERRA